MLRSKRDRSRNDYPTDLRRWSAAPVWLHIDVRSCRCPGASRSRRSRMGITGTPRRRRRRANWLVLLGRRWRRGATRGRPSGRCKQEGVIPRHPSRAAQVIAPDPVVVRSGSLPRSRTPAASFRELRLPREPPIRRDRRPFLFALHGFEEHAPRRGATAPRANYLKNDGAHSGDQDDGQGEIEHVIAVSPVAKSSHLSWARCPPPGAVRGCRFEADQQCLWCYGPA